ncbi:MAG: hypothetical protein IPM13_16935 [Phycisphaerales bacterium]|nr:hypothetical protein [Phycisphaerales bacterium]
MKDLERWSKKHQVPFRFLAFSHEHAGRAAASPFVRRNGLSPRAWAEAAFRAYWVDDRDISDEAVLAELLQRPGADARGGAGAQPRARGEGWTRFAPPRRPRARPRDLRRPGVRRRRRAVLRQGPPGLRRGRSGLSQLSAAARHQACVCALRLGLLFGGRAEPPPSSRGSRPRTPARSGTGPSPRQAEAQAAVVGQDGDAERVVREHGHVGNASSMRAPRR